MSALRLATSKPKRLKPNLSYVLPSAIGHVYFFGSPDGRFVKIGWTGDIQRRWKDIQASHPEPLMFLGAIAGDEAKEHHFHRYCAAHRVSGEWFRLDDYMHSVIGAACAGTLDTGPVTIAELKADSMRLARRFRKDARRRA